MTGTASTLGITDRALGAAARQAVRRIRSGRIELTEGGARTAGGPAGQELKAAVTVHDPRAWALIARRSSTGLGEGYIDGLWDTDDLVTLLRIGAREIARFDRLRSRLWKPRSLLHRLLKLVPRNTREGARDNISAHYDLGNDLFETMLDSRMQYSSAIFPTASTDLEAAQLTKLDRICQALELSPGDHLLEIGTGWGGLAAHAAAEYGCRVTTTTISREQRALATRRISEARLDDRVSVLGSDYRDLSGTFSKLVSVEMIEAVGWQYFDTFFAKCSDLLETGGLMLLQAITIPNLIYEVEKDTRTFANTHIFPGGCLPSEGAIANSARRVTDLRHLSTEQIGQHYAPTLAAWRERFLDGWERLSGSYDERFKRFWVFYLSYCEAGFREHRIGDAQILFVK